jgi:hypothetical protein
MIGNRGIRVGYDASMIHHAKGTMRSAMMRWRGERSSEVPRSWSPGHGRRPKPEKRRHREPFSLKRETPGRRRPRPN